MRPYLLAFALLAGCQSSIGGHRFHLAPASETEGRNEARQVQASLAQFVPMMVYNHRNRSLNVVLTIAASDQVVRTELDKVGLRPLAGLLQPSPGFLARSQCGIRRSCDTRQLTRCTFTTIISVDEKERHMRDFAERLLYSAYPALGVVAAGGEGGRMVLSVPFFDQCDMAARQLETVWGEVADGDRKTFQLLRP